MLATKDDDSIIKLSDFGFAKEANEGLITPKYINILSYILYNYLFNRRIIDKATLPIMYPLKFYVFKNMIFLVIYGVWEL